MQNEIITSAAPVALTGRTVAEITADIRVNYRNAKASIVAIGRDLAEVKQLLNHGEWLPYLQQLNISVSSAENYMRYAAEIPGDERLAALPYSAAMALIALPEPERQKIQEQDLEGKSAAEIKRLIAEVKAEKKRADDEKRRADENEHTADSAYSTIQTLEKKLAARPIITETVTPDDYDDLKDAVERLKEQLTEAEDAAAEAEERANAAIAQAQTSAMQQLDGSIEETSDGKLSLPDFVSICNDFQSKVWAVPYMKDAFAVMPNSELSSYRLMINGVRTWAEQALSAISSAAAAISVEGVVISDCEK